MNDDKPVMYGWEKVFEGVYEINGVKARWISEVNYKKIMEEIDTLRLWLKASESANRSLWEENERLMSSPSISEASKLREENILLRHKESLHENTIKETIKMRDLYRSKLEKCFDALKIYAAPELENVFYGKALSEPVAKEFYHYGNAARKALKEIGEMK